MTLLPSFSRLCRLRSVRVLLVVVFTPHRKVAEFIPPSAGPTMSLL